MTSPTRPARRRKAAKRQFGNVRRLPSGRVQARFTGPDGREHSAPTTFNTKGDAEAWLSIEHSKIIRKKWVPEDPGESARAVPSTLTLLEYVGDLDGPGWLSERRLAIRTREHYARLLVNHILPRFGDTPLTQITNQHVRTWYAGLAPKHPTARAHTYALLRTILNTAVDDELIPTNPCRIRGAGQSPPATEIEPATTDELVIMVETMPERYRLAVLLAAWCAPRQGELLELRRRDVDLTNEVLRIRHSVARTRTQGRVVKEPKSAAGVRVVTIPSNLLPAIEDHLQRFAAPGPDGLLFPGTTKTGHLSETTPNRHWYKARAAAGRPDLNWHSLRHTGATMAADSGVPLKALMRRMGHSTPAMALRYQHAAKGHDKQIAEHLSMVATAGNVTPIAKAKSSSKKSRRRSA